MTPATPQPLRPGPQAGCPRCGTALAGGPVVFWCPRCARRVQAADLDLEFRPCTPEVAR